MIDRKTRAEIRRLFFAEHWKVGTIATQLSVHPDTVRRALQTDSFAWRGTVRPSALDPYIELIADTLGRYPKLTGTRVHEMLRARGFAGSPAQVRRRILQLDRTCSPCPVRGERRGDVTSTGVLFGRRQPPRSSEATSPIAAR